MTVYSPSVGVTWYNRPIILNCHNGTARYFEFSIIAEGATEKAYNFFTTVF
jgi:hypothetical protein